MKKRATNSVAGLLTISLLFLGCASPPPPPPCPCADIDQRLEAQSKELHSALKREGILRKRLEACEATARPIQ